LTIPPLRAPARDAAQPESEPVAGWCAACATAGEYVLAAYPDGAACQFHARLHGPLPTPSETRPRADPPSPCPPPPTAGPSRPEPSGPGRRGRAGRRERRATARAVGRARERARGRDRARRRLQRGRFKPHPGWRGRIDPGAVVLTDQAAALARIEQLVDAEHWRADRRASWTAMLRRLAYAMDWNGTGLVCGVTREQLATAGGCSPRTVSRLLEWAQDVGLVVVVERGASAAFLRADTNRAPSYVLVAGADFLEESRPELHPATGESAHVSGPVDESGNLPQSSVGSNPLRGRRPDHPKPFRAGWPLWQVPATAAERNAAVATLLARIGLDGRVAAWRARALLCQWWQAGACVAGLLHAVDHHPDRPDEPRGDALRGASDPLRVLGYRLAPWVGRLGELPPHLHGRAGDYRAEQAARVAERTAAADRPTRRRPASTAAAREAARAQLAAALAARRDRTPPTPGGEDTGEQLGTAHGRSGRAERHAAGRPRPGAGDWPA
jgi:hypothetical protein